MRKLAIPVLLFFASSAQAAVDFESKILPILEAKCVECHKAPHEENGRTRKPKAGLRFDAAWAILAGSEDGAVLTPGEPGKSEMFFRVTLPQDDDDLMPPTGKADPLTKKEISLLESWIKEGADFGEWEGNLEGKPRETSTPEEPPPVPKTQLTYERLSADLPEIDDEAWAEISAAGGRVQRLKPGSPLLEIDFRLLRAEADDSVLALLEPVAAHIAHLDLSRTSVTDEGLSVLRKTPRLVRLNLSRTGIGDPALKHVGSLKELTYLNLHETAVTDAGLKHLRSLPSVESIYLWKSKATGAGVKQLQKALPDAKIVFE